MNKITKFVHKLVSKPKKAVLSALVVSTALLTFAGLAVINNKSNAEYYPARTPFDYSKPCNANDSNIYDRCGSLTGPVFNSFINTPSYGDERAFVDARRSDQTSAGSFKNVLTNVTGGSKEIVVRLYVHNNANQSTNASGLGVAKNTKVRVSVPTATAQALRARGYISADNASPKLVEDTVDFTAPSKFKVSYITGSARLYDNDNFKNGVKLSDSIVGSGALIGSDKLDGKFKGCFEYEAVIQVRLKVTPASIPQVKFEKQVAVSGQSTWGESVSVKPGDNTKWLVSFANSGKTDLTNVNISDKLPPHLKVVSGSVKWIYAGVNGATQTITQNDTQFFTTGGINFGTWKPNGGFYVRFDATAKDDFEGCKVVLRNIAYNKTSQTGKIEDNADVTITKPNCVPQKPEYSCNLLSATKLSDRKYKFSVNASAAGGASINHYVYDFGDNTDNFHTDKTTVEHTYAKPGDYAITVVVKVNVNGGVKDVSSDSCRTVISIGSKPGQPSKELVNTGPGSMFGIFTATSAVGAFLHRRWSLSRR